MTSKRFFAASYSVGAKCSFRLSLFALDTREELCAGGAKNAAFFKHEPEPEDAVYVISIGGRSHERGLKVQHTSRLMLRPRRLARSADEPMRKT